MKLPLRKVDVMNSYDANVRIAYDKEMIEFDERRFPVPNGFKLILDAEGDLVALVPDHVYKDWNHAETIVELLNWAAANYPYRHGDAE
jgi:hypothetical protein